MLSEYSKHKILAEHVGTEIANTLFLSMLNPRYRGKKFTWDKLHDWAVGKAETDLFIYYEIQFFRKHKDELTDIAKRAASDRVKRCLAETEVEQWLILTPTEE